MNYSEYINPGMKKTSEKNCLLLLDNGNYFLGKVMDLIPIILEKSVSIPQ